MKRRLMQRLAAVAGVVTAVAGLSAMVSAQASEVTAQGPGNGAGTPAFEVASVKPSNPDPGPLGQIPRVMPPLGGRFTAMNVPLRMFVRMAYSLQDFQLVGGPAWMATTRFDIVAKAEDGAAPAMDALSPMLRTLLAERFALKAHTETRELPTYALVVARDDRKLGPALRPSTTDCSNAQAETQKRLEALARGGLSALTAVMPKPGEVVPCALSPLIPAGGPAAGFGLRANGLPLNALAALLTSLTGRTVRDQTGLAGLYDWEATFDPQVMLALASQAGVNLPAGISLPPSDSPSLLTALREQLGLKLDSTRGPVDVLVIDDVQMPTPD